MTNPNRSSETRTFLGANAVTEGSVQGANTFTGANTPLAEVNGYRGTGARRAGANSFSRDFDRGNPALQSYGTNPSEVE